MTSEINKIIPAEIKYDEFYQAIKQIAQEEEIQTILEIGSSSGEGSTEAFVTGIRENPHHPQLFCMEISQARFTELQKRYAKGGFVKGYNVSSVGKNKFATEKEVIDFYNSYTTALNQYPLERVLDWLKQDLKYLQDSGVSQTGIKQIKSENKIIFFDVVLIDGSEFTGEAELDEVYGAKFILLDDINTFKNHKNYHKLLKDPNYKLLLHNLHLRNGYAIFQLEKFAFNEEQIEQRLVQRLVRQGMTVFDIGANIGNYSILFSHLVGSEGKVYSFEPTSTTFKKLQERMQQEKYTNIFTFQNAVFSENKQIEFNEFPDEFSVWNTIGRPQMENPANPQEYVPLVKTETVDAIALDSFCQQHNIEKIDYLKIDVEGAESDVLLGATGLLNKKVIQFIQFEISQKMLEGLNRRAQDTFDLLKKYGYECHRIEKDGAIGAQVAGSNSFYENYIAFIPAEIKKEVSPRDVSKQFTSTASDPGEIRPMNKSLSHLSLKNKNAIEFLFESGKPIKLELGASEKRMEGWTTIDLDPRSDLCLDLSQPLPFPDNCVEQIYSSHLLEHFSYPSPMVNLLSECYRVLQPGGVFKVAVPNARIYIEAYGKPESFDAQKNCLYKPAFHYHSKRDFINYIAYMDGHHRFLFDEENLPKIIANAGFEDVRLRAFELGLDLEARKHESIYVEGTKPLAGTKPLSVHFFTIVLNGEPFIRYHIDVLKKLPFRWHWHIVEGVADLKHDTAWSVALGGNISDDVHRDGRSLDGTTEYLDELARLYPQNISIYRKPEGKFWEGKREMINAPIARISEECLLWQIDVDELWTFEQICQTRQMFIEHPEKTAAFYWCWYFVGENLVISTRNCYANNPQYEWLRTWRLKPGMVWATHEPPRLAEPLPNGKWRDVAFVNPFQHQETEKEGLVFQHFAYVTPNQLRFKEQYYGYKNATSQWLNLQQQTQFPVLLRQYFDWVKDESQVNSAIACGVEPLAQRDINTKNWHFKTLSALPALAVNPSQKYPTILIDGVFFQHNNTGIARVWKSLWQEWANTNFAQKIIILDRNGTAPKIPGIRYRTIPLYDYGNTDRDRAMLQQICDEEKADLFISTYYTTPLSTPSVFMAYDMIPELMGQNIGHSEWREKHSGIRHASAYITISENTARDLVKVFPHISSNSIAVAHCGMDANFSPADREEISGFKSKYSITKPYFLLVGERVGWHGYKNGILFFKAFSQLANKFDFDIVCAGGKPVLEPELRLYSSGITVHTLQLSDSELKAAYSGALVLVYPSKYEGFGLPVLEAMACGCPVITCPNGSIPEVAGKAAVYVNGDDVIGLVNALREIQNPGVRNSLIAAGLEQAKKFSWSKMAAIVSSVLVQVAERTHSENASVQQPTDAGLQGEFGNGENSQPVPSAFKVSAIVSTYNSEKFIRGCLQDLVEQTLYKQGQLEIIVIDSGSQENEQSVVREFQAKYPNIVYDRTSDRETLYAAWNRGIKMSRGAYMTNANTDDRHRPDALEIMAKYLDENATVSLVYADQLITSTANDTFAKTQAEKRWNWPAFDYSELERRCIIGPQPMWRKSLHEKYGYFRTEFTAAGDYEFWLRIGKTENIVYLPEILGLYCENQQGLEHSSPISQQETRQIWDEYGIARRGVKPATTLPVSISPLQLNAMPYRTCAETLVSVIIPCYNHATLLREAVESVVSQTYPNWECIIVNDGSTDDTSNFAKYLIKLYPKKSLRLIDKANTGPADSRNLGVQQSSGKFILFLDADDKLHPKFLEECVEILLAKPNVGFVYTDVQQFGANCDLVIHGDFEANRFLRDNQAPATSLFRREIYEQVGGLKKVMKLGCEDWEFWISAYEKGWLGERLPKPYLYYRQHGDGSSRTQKMAGDRPKLDLMRATIIHLHSQLYKPEEVRWSQQILQQHGNLIANELVEFNKPEQFLTLLSQYVGEYQKDQANEVNLANIRQSRQQLANYWLNLPAEQLANAYSGDAGKAHQLLLNSNIKDEALTDAEKTVIDRLAAHLSQGIKTPKDINYLLAASLYRRADQLWLNYQNAAIPNWFVNGYLKFMFAAPTLFQEIGEADNYCRYVQGWVSYLHSNIFKNQNSQVWQDIAGFFTQGANFIPLYFNSENLKDIYTKRADIIEYTLKIGGAAIDCIFPARPANRQKIRVGVLTKHFGAMTETFATLPAFEYLNREQFEIILYALNLDGNKLEQYCQSRADRLVKLSSDLPSQVQTIRADDLDILLIATNITAVTHPISLLALHRLARVQTTCFNSPITTGMRHVDYYIAGKLMEPAPEGQEHYREQLATIDGPGCCFSYTLEPYTPNINFTRNSIGISEESVVFVSSANLYKLVPELRETWAKIMAAVPNSLLFLMPFGPSWTNHYPGGAFVNNMKAVFAKYGIESNRLRVLKSLPNRADVKEVLKLGDVYLDSYPYAGTTSLVDPLEVGLPTVVRDGDTLRSRMGAAVVRSLSMPDLIANSEASYIQLAVTLGTNPELRQRYRQEIQQKMQANPACFDSVAYSGAIGKLFQELFGKWQTSHQEASRSLQDSIPKQPDLGDILSNAVNLYQRNSSNISAISELRQIRKQIADFWLNVPAENLETAYKSASGNSYQILFKSGFQHQAMIESEQIFLQQLTQISKGLVHPKAVNALLAAMLYFPPGTMRIPDARNRLPHWLIGDYEQVFETEAAVKSDSSSDLLAQYIQSPQFANQLLGCVNLYRIDPSDESLVLELRQIRKQMADFWLTVPSEKLENFYRGEVRKGYQAILKCGLQAEAMTEAEQKFLQRLTEISKGLVQPQAINALLGAMLYFVPGKMRVPDARTRLPQWLLEDYEKVFESAFATTEQTVVKQDYLPQFLNQLTAAVNLYEIDPTAEFVIADLRHIRKQMADLWLSVSGEQVEVLYRSDFGKGYKAMLGSGFINEPLHESDREFFNSLVVELSKGFGAPKAVNNLLAAMLYCRPGQLRVQDANTSLPPWLLADYEQLVGGAVKVAVG